MGLDLLHLTLLLRHQLSDAYVLLLGDLLPDTLLDVTAACLVTEKLMCTARPQGQRPLTAK